MKKLVGIILVFALSASLGACKQSESAKAVDELISAIGEVTSQSKPKILQAENAYNALSEEDKKDVKGEKKLEKAREKLEKILEEKEKKEIDNIINLIDKMGKVDVENYDNIKKIYKAYSMLPVSKQNKVTNSQILLDAVEQIRAVQQEQAEELLGKMRLIEDSVQSTKSYMPKAIPIWDDGLDPYERCYILPYIEQREGVTKLRTIFNYTGDSWIFYNTLTFAIDDERTEKTINRSDITRDNDAGYVFELADIYPSEDVVELLRKITKSNNAVIRFSGNDYYYDLTINSNDKSAIKEVLDAYDLLV